MRVLPLLLCLLASKASHADLILNLTGTAGSRTVSFEATGSVTVQNATAHFSSLTQAPWAAGSSWVDFFDDEMGDVFDFSGTHFQRLSSTVSYRVNDVEFVQLDHVAFDNLSGIPTHDGVGLMQSDFVVWPALSGDDLSWVGSGTFELFQDFDSFFNVGTYTSPIQGGDYVVNVGFAAVPEPSGLGVLLFLCTGLWCARRPRRVTF